MNSILYRVVNFKRHQSANHSYVVIGCYLKQTTLSYINGRTALAVLFSVILCHSLLILAHLNLVLIMCHKNISVAARSLHGCSQELCMNKV